MDRPGSGFEVSGEAGSWVKQDTPEIFKEKNIRAFASKEEKPQEEKKSKAETTSALAGSPAGAVGPSQAQAPPVGPAASGPGPSVGVGRWREDGSGRYSRQALAASPAGAGVWSGPGWQRPPRSQQKKKFISWHGDCGGCNDRGCGKPGFHRHP